MLSRQEQSQPGRNVVGIERTQGFEAREYKKNLRFSAEISINGERAGIRTRDPLIKSQMLYQLSYAPLNNEACIEDKSGEVNKKN